MFSGTCGACWVEVSDCVRLRLEVTLLGMLMSLEPVLVARGSVWSDVVDLDDTGRRSGRELSGCDRGGRAASAFGALDRASLDRVLDDADCERVGRPELPELLAAGKDMLTKS